MATTNKIKSINIHQTNNYSINEQGEGLLPFSSWASNYNISPECNAQDLIIEKKYLILSFDVERDSVLFEYFEKPVIYLAVTGYEYGKTSLTRKRVMFGANIQNNSAQINLTWDGSAGTLRLLIPTSSFNEFNKISSISVIAQRWNDSNGSTAMGYIYVCDGSNLDNNEKQKILNVLKQNTSDLDKFNLSQFTTGNSDKIIRITPISNYISYTPYGFEFNNTLNTKYYHKKIQININSTRQNPWDETIYPSSCIANGNTMSTTDDGRTWNLTFTNSPNLLSASFVYKGYLYTPKKQKKLSYYKTAISANSDDSFFNVFSYQGTRWRNKVVDFIKTNQKAAVRVRQYDVVGTFTIKEPNIFPYDFKIKNSTKKETSFCSNFFPDPLEYNNSTLSTNSSVEVAGINSTTLLSVDKKHMEIYDRFTGLKYSTNPQDAGSQDYQGILYINIPLITEHKYCLVGFSPYLKINGNKCDVLNEQEIVLYKGDSNFVLENVDLGDTYLLDLSLPYEYNGTTPMVVNEVTKQWVCHESLSPLTNPSKEFVYLTNKEKTSSYFQYWYIDVQKDSKSIPIEEIRFPFNFDYYSLLYSNLKLTNIQDVITNLKIQDNKLFFKLNYPGLGDYNDEFQGNQFINHAIDSNASIGLSLNTRKEQFTVSVNGYDDPIIEIGTLNGNTLTYKTLLQFFYININQIVDIPEDLLSNLQSSEIPLVFKYTRRYIDNNKQPFDYVIFEFNYSVPIISGIRPLGLRKNGIIVNPFSQNENLEDGVAQKINSKLYDFDLENGVVRATILQTDVSDNNGFLGNLAKKRLIEYEEEKVSGQYTGIGHYLFDGINLQELQKQTVDESNVDSLINKIKDLNNIIGNESSGLTHTVNDNYYAINSQIKPYLGTISINTEEKTSSFNAGDGKIDDVYTFDFSIIEGSKVLPTIFINFTNGSIANQREAIILLQGCTQSGTNCTVSYRVYCPSQSALAGNHAKFNVTVRLLSIYIPNFTTAAALTFNLPSPAVTEITEEEKIEEVIEETPTEQTEVTEPEILPDGESAE